MENFANLPSCVPLLILSPALKRWGSPKREASCSQAAHLQATADFVPRSKVLGTPPWGTGYLAHLPTCGLLLIVSPTVNRWGPPLDGRGYVANLLSCRPLLVGSNALKGWGPPSRQGLCGQIARLQATADFASPLKSVGTPTPSPRRHGLCSHSAHLRAIADFVLRAEALGSTLEGKGYVAYVPTWGPLLNGSATVKGWGRP